MGSYLYTKPLEAKLHAGRKDGGWGRKLHELGNKNDEAYEIQHPIMVGRGVQ